MISYARVHQTYKEVFPKAGGFWEPIITSVPKPDRTVQGGERTGQAPLTHELRCGNSSETGAD